MTLQILSLIALLVQVGENSENCTVMSNQHIKTTQFKFSIYRIRQRRAGNHYNGEGVVFYQKPSSMMMKEIMFVAAQHLSNMHMWEIGFTFFHDW